METLLSTLKSKIEKELKGKYNDINVYVVENWQTLTEKNFMHEHYGKGYAGQEQSKIVVSWNKFYDKIAGNEWMYGSNQNFKFDKKTGQIINFEDEISIEEAVEIFINHMQKEYRV